MKHFCDISFYNPLIEFDLMNFFAVQVYISPVKMVLFQTCSLICLVHLLPYIFSLYFDLTL